MRLWCLLCNPGGKDDGGPVARVRVPNNPSFALVLVFVVVDVVVITRHSARPCPRYASFSVCCAPSLLANKAHHLCNDR